MVAAPAPADGPEPLSVENGVDELRDTPSIEADPDALVTERHQMRDTFPHVEIGMPSMEGLEPEPRPAPPSLLSLGASTGSKLPSLKDFSTRPAATKTGPALADPIPSSGPVAPIDDVLLQRVWREIAEESRAKERMSEYTLLNRAVAAGPDHRIELTVDNPVQEDQFNEMRTEFLVELRRRTGHPRLNVVPVMAQAAPTARKLYTATDKFEYLAERFPALREAKQRLGLEADF